MEYWRHEECAHASTKWGEKLLQHGYADLYSHPRSEYTPIRDIVHRRNPTSAPFLPSGRSFEGVGSGITALQTTVSDDSSGGEVGARFLITNNTPRVSRPFCDRRAASFRLGLRKSRKVRLLVVRSQVRSPLSRTRLSHGPVYPAHTD